MYRTSGKPIILLLGLGLLLGQPGWCFAAGELEQKAQVKEISQELICLCGCGNMILDTCTCGEATENKKFIAQLLREGKTKPQILKIMAQKYGEHVLAAPKREGLNWVVWVVVPYVIPVLAAVMIAFIIVKWARKKKETLSAPSPEVPSTPPDPLTDKYRRQMEQELKDFE